MVPLLHIHTGILLCDDMEQQAVSLSGTNSILVC